MGGVGGAGSMGGTCAVGMGGIACTGTCAVGMGGKSSTSGMGVAGFAGASEGGGSHVTWAAMHGR